MISKLKDEQTNAVVEQATWSVSNIALVLCAAVALADTELSFVLASAAVLSLGRGPTRANRLRLVSGA